MKNLETGAMTKTNQNADAQPAVQRENRQWKMHANLLYKVIREQAGSFAKAMMEAVQNAIDSGGSKVTIRLDGKKFLIEDDGGGFASREVIENFFETWGTPHDEAEADRPRYGQHRLGRGQIFAYARNVWESNGFRMEVDFRNNRDGYILSSVSPPVKGCRIEGELYEPLLPSDLYEVEKTLKDLVYYSEIQVIYNNEDVAHPPTKEKWTFEDDDAYYLVRDYGPLKVYNLGMLVCQYPGHTYGLSGTVVSKKQLALNIARNAIVDSECAVWKRIRKTLRARSDAGLSSKKSTRLTEDDRCYLAARIKAKEFPEWWDVDRLSLLRIASGKDVDLGRLFNYEPGRKETHHSRCKVTLCASEDRRIGERLARLNGNLVVVHPKTLHRFDEPDLASFLKVFRTLYGVSVPQIVSFDEAVRDAGINGKHCVLDDNEMSQIRRIQIGAIRKINNDLARTLDVHPRKITGGASDTAEAWTDGNYIAINVKRLHLDGLPSADRVIHLLAHEYAHDMADLGEHDHDLAFYERFHDWVCERHPGSIAPKLIQSYLDLLREEGMPLPATALRLADQFAHIDTSVAQEDNFFDDADEPGMAAG